MKYIKSNERSFSIHDPQGIKLLSRLKLNFTYFNEHKFRHNVKDCVCPMCGCGLEIESTQYFFLRCHFYHVERLELLNSPYHIDLTINELKCHKDKCHKETNRKILLNCITYLKVTKRFDEPLLCP